MTFYNIIYAIVFLGATMEFFKYLFDGQNSAEKLAFSSIVTLLIFIDTIYSADSLEKGHKNVYTRSMKFIDLFCFLIFCFLIILINPDSNILGTKFVYSFPWGITSNQLFFLLLALYFIFALLWNYAVSGNRYFRMKNPHAWYYCVGSVVFIIISFVINSMDTWWTKCVVYFLDFIIVFFVIIDFLFKPDQGIGTEMDCIAATEYYIEPESLPLMKHFQVRPKTIIIKTSVNGKINVQFGKFIQND